MPMKHKQNKSNIFNSMLEEVYRNGKGLGGGGGGRQVEISGFPEDKHQQNNLQHMNFELAQMIKEDSKDLSELVNNREKLLEPGGKRSMKEHSDRSMPLIEDPTHFNPLILNKGRTLRGRDLFEVEEDDEEEEVKHNCNELQVTVSIPLEALDVQCHNENQKGTLWEPLDMIETPNARNSRSSQLKQLSKDGTVRNLNKMSCDDMNHIPLSFSQHIQETPKKMDPHLFLQSNRDSLPVSQNDDALFWQDNSEPQLENRLPKQLLYRLSLQNMTPDDIKYLKGVLKKASFKDHESLASDAAIAEQLHDTISGLHPQVRVQFQNSLGFFKKDSILLGLRADPAIAEADEEGIKQERHVADQFLLKPQVSLEELCPKESQHSFANQESLNILCNPLSFHEGAGFIASLNLQVSHSDQHVTEKNDRLPQTAQPPLVLEEDNQLDDTQRHLINKDDQNQQSFDLVDQYASKRLIQPRHQKSLKFELDVEDVDDHQNPKNQENLKQPADKEEEKVKPLYEQTYTSQGFAQASLFIFGESSWVRRWVFRLVQSKYFENGMIVAIIANSICLAFYDYNDRDGTTEYNKQINKWNFGFTIVFLVETILRVIAHGMIIGTNAYLRSGWNIIDAAVVVSGVLEISLGTLNLKSLRVVRVFRPLKTINTVKSIRKLIQALIRSIPDFANVVMFLVYIFLLFATVGLHQYNGAYYNSCRYHPEPESLNSWATDISYDRVCSTSELGAFICPKGQYCRNPSDNKIYDYSNEKMDDRWYVNFGITNFDNLGTSLLSVFQIVTSDTWFQQMCNLMDIDIPVFGGVYVILMMIMGQFFLMNLILAVIIFSFIKSQQDELKSRVDAYHQEEKLKETIKQEIVHMLHSHQSSHQQLSHESDTPSFRQEKEQTKDEVKQVIAQNVIALGTHFNENLAEPTLKLKEDKGITDAAQEKKSHMLSLQDHSAFKVKKTSVNSKKREYKSSISNLLKDPSKIKEKKDDFSNEDLHFGTFLKSKAQERMVADMFSKAKDFKGELKHHHQMKPQVNIPQVLEVTKDPSKIEEPLIEKPPSGAPLGEVLKWARQQKRLEELKKASQDPSEVSVAHHNANFGSSEGVHSLHHQTSADPPPSSLMEKLFKKKLQVPGGKNVDADGGPTLFKKLFKQYIEKKIEHEYQNYFKTILKEAQERQGNQKANMREIVGIKVGLEFMREQQVEKERNLEAKKCLNERMQKSQLYRWAHGLLESSYFSGFIIFAIVSNTLILSLDKYPIDENRVEVLEKLNYLFTAIFVVEIIIKFLAFGIKSFFKGSWFNTFDLLIVIGSLVDIIIAQVLLDSTGKKKTGSVITALRGFRLLRIFKLARSWKRFELLLETMASTLKDVASFSVLLFLFIYIFTLLGMELFAHKTKLDPDTGYVDLDNGESPTFNFDNFLNSFSLVFIILTNDGTSAIYYNHYRAVGAFTSSVFFMSLVIVGQKIIMNLFVAILLENFDEGVLKQKMIDYEETQRGVLENGGNAPNGFWGILKAKLNAFDQFLQRKVTQCRKGIVTRAKTLRNQLGRRTEEVEDSDEEQKKEPIVLKLGLMNKEHHHNHTKLGVKEQTKQESEIVLEGNPLFIIPKSWKVRGYIGTVINNKYYDWVIVTIIIVSSVQLALDTPLLDPSSTERQVLYWIDFLTTVVFIVECFLKILTYGLLYNGSKSYLRSPWNRLDFAIVIFSIVAVTPISSKDLKAFKVFRIFRLVSRNAGLQAAVKALMLGMPKIFNVTIIMLLFFLIFGVISVSQFKGMFYHCEEAQEVPQNGDMQHKWDCLSAGGEWVNQIYNFDDIPNAMVTLFVMATTAGWQDVLVNSITSTQLDYVAQDYRSPFWSFFFILFMIIGFFFFLNLFVGVVVSNFQTEKDKIGGNDLLTEQQREWIDLKLLVLRSAPIRKIQPPNDRFRLWFFKIESHPQFENTIFVMIALNTLLLMLNWYQQSQKIVLVLESINYVFTAIFMAEAAIKIIAQGPRIFFRDSWNTFDFIVAVVTAVSIVVSLNSSLQIKGAVTLFRSFRILRVLRLLKRGGKNLHMIFNTFVITLQSLVNIGALLLLIIYMYSVLGMILFGTQMRTGLMNDWMNFENFINSFMMLFVVTTGDSWNAFQTSFVVENSILYQCLENPTYQDYAEAGNVALGCTPRALAYAFFTSYYFIVALIFLQLFIAVILQGYDDTQVQEARLFNNEMNTTFRERWADFDPEATTFIKIYQLRDFLSSIGSPLGFDEEHRTDKFLQDKFIASLDLPTYYDFSKYQFLDVLDALSFRLMVIDHLKKLEEEKRMTQKTSAENREQDFRRMDSQVQKNMKEQLEKEVNKLIYQRNSANITAVQNMVAKEMNQVRNHDKVSGLTSSHQMAAESAIHRWKAFANKSQRDKLQLSDGPELREKALSKLGAQTTLIFYRPSTDQLARSRAEHNNSRNLQKSQLEESYQRPAAPFGNFTKNQVIQNEARVGDDLQASELGTNRDQNACKQRDRRNMVFNSSSESSFAQEEVVDKKLEVIQQEDNRSQRSSEGHINLHSQGQSESSVSITQIQAEIFLQNVEMTLRNQQN